MPTGNRGVIVPSSAQAIASSTGHVTTPWQRFFNALVAAAAPIASIDLPLLGSPLTYTAAQTGTLVVTGGTVTGITLTRGTTTVSGLSSPVAMANGDVAEITYAVDPTVTFIPA